MVYEPCYSAFLRGINEGIFIDPEEVTASNSTLEISILSEISNLLSDFLTHILDNHIIHGYVFHGVQTPVVDCRTSKFDRLLSLLKLIESKNISIGTKIFLLIVEISHKATV